ncbi:MAG: RsbS, negative regulator of sigma-B, partial [uncultured Frankineae bacterium]
ARLHPAPGRLPPGVDQRCPGRQRDAALPGGAGGAHRRRALPRRDHRRGRPRRPGQLRRRHARLARRHGPSPGRRDRRGRRQPRDRLHHGAARHEHPPRPHRARPGAGPAGARPADLAAAAAASV